MLPNIARLNLDYTNQGQLEPARFDVTLAENIVDKADDYVLSIEKAESPLKNLAIMSMMRDYKVRIYIPDNFLLIIAGTGLSVGYNEFVIKQQEIYTIQSFIDQLNAIIYDKSLNDNDDHLGKFDYIDGKIRFTMTNNEYVLNDHNEYARVWVDEEIKYLTDSIPHLYTSTNNGLSEVKYKEFLDNLDYGPGADETPYGEQQFNLITRFFQFKSVRIYSSLPTRAYYIYDQDVGKLTRSNLLQEFILNSENFVEGMPNMIYIPTTHKETELCSTQAIKDFNIYFMVHYKNGKDINLMIDKDEYMSLTLAFLKK